MKEKSRKITIYQARPQLEALLKLGCSRLIWSNLDWVDSVLPSVSAADHIFHQSAGLCPLLEHSDVKPSKQENNEQKSLNIKQEEGVQRSSILQRPSRHHLQMLPSGTSTEIITGRAKPHLASVPPSDCHSQHVAAARPLSKTGHGLKPLLHRSGPASTDPQQSQRVKKPKDGTNSSQTRSVDSSYFKQTQAHIIHYFYTGRAKQDFLELTFGTGYKLLPVRKCTILPQLCSRGTQMWHSTERN